MTHVVIVGAGHAGGRVAQHLVRLGHIGPVTLIGDEPHPPYERPPLSKEYLAGRRETSALWLADQPGDAANLSRLQGHVERIDVNARRVILADGQSVAYDRLVLATGTGARRLPLPGADLPHVHVLRTIGDADRLRETLLRARRLAVIGGGVIALEVAATAREMGVEVTIVQLDDRVMERCLSPSASAWLRGVHERHGVRFYTRHAVIGIGPDTVNAETQDGKGQSIPADCVLVAAGAVPLLPEIVGVGIDTRDGIVVDRWCRVPGRDEIYAVGDVTRMGPDASRQETWRNAENSARAVAEILCGRGEPYDDISWMWTDQYGHNIQVVGTPHHATREIVRGDLDSGHGSLFYLSADDRLRGAILINEARNRRVAEKLIRDGAPVNPAQLADATVRLNGPA